MAILLSILSAALFGAADFLCGLSARRLTTMKVLACSQLAGGVLVFVLAPATSSGLPALSDLVWGGLAGLSGAGGLYFLYTGLAKGRMAIVSPISALVSALVPAAYGALVGEKPGIAALAGAGLCLPAMALLAWEDERGDTTFRNSAVSEAGAAKPEHVPENERSRTRRSLFFGPASGALLGGFYIFISRCSVGSGLWPLAWARASSLLVIASLLAFGRVSGRIGHPRRSSIPSDRRAIIASLAGGLLDISANFAFLSATRAGLLMMVSVVSSLYPAPTVLLARVFLGERLSRRRTAGLALALAGIILAVLGGWEKP